MSTKAVEASPYTYALREADKTPSLIMMVCTAAEVAFAIWSALSGNYYATITAGIMALSFGFLAYHFYPSHCYLDLTIDGQVFSEYNHILLRNPVLMPERIKQAAQAFFIKLHVEVLIREIKSLGNEPKNSQIDEIFHKLWKIVWDQNNPYVVVNFPREFDNVIFEHLRRAGQRVLKDIPEGQIVCNLKNARGGELAGELSCGSGNGPINKEKLPIILNFFRYK